jgi:8-amino-7-oxononanoate synthase
MRIDGREVCMLAGANYLDLAGDPRVIEAAALATERHGAASGGSRLIAGNTRLHEALEADLARFCRSESALVFSTGYMANLGVVTALAGPDDVVVSDAWNHASIIDACRLSQAETRVFAHDDAADLERVLRGCGGFRRRLVITDGVYSMDGDVARLETLLPVAREHGAFTIVDDAHGFGVLGPTGRGVAEQAEPGPDLLVGNLGKALGSFGAFVACSARVRELLVNTARSFVFTCGLAPGAVGAAQEALRIIEREPERRRSLLERAEQLRKGLAATGFDTGRSTTQIVPAIIGPNRATMQLCEAALERGIYAQGIRYPSVPEGTARLRFTPMSSHTREEIDAVVETFAELRHSMLA